MPNPNDILPIDEDDQAVPELLRKSSSTISIDLTDVSSIESTASTIDPNLTENQKTA